MKVLLTGATGFVGSQLARRLLADGHELGVLLRPGGDRSRIAGLVGKATVVEGDVCVAGDVERAASEVRPELCYHLAWCATGDYLTSAENLRLLAASHRLAEAVAASGCRRFVGVGTCFEYDTRQGYLRESTPTAPHTLYAASKLAAYLTLEQLCRLSGMELAWARLFYLYGPGENEKRLVPHVITSLLRGETVPLTKGEHVRDFVHVEDVASALAAIGASDLAGPVNVGLGQPVTVRDLALRLGELVGRSDLIDLGAQEYRPTDPPFVCADNALLRERTGWRPRYGKLDEGLEATLRWWRDRLSAGAGA